MGETKGKEFSVLGVELTMLNILAREELPSGCGAMKNRQICEKSNHTWERGDRGYRWGLGSESEIGERRA